MHARTLEVLEDIEVTEHLLRLGVVVPRFTIRDRDRPLLEIPFDDLPTRYPYTLMLPQDVTERVLGERLAALGGRVHRPLAVTGVAIGDDGADVTAARPDGSTVSVHARYVVGCDGMHSAVREQSGIGFTGDRYAQSFVLADVGMTGHSARRGEPVLLARRARRGRPAARGPLPRRGHPGRGPGDARHRRRPGAARRPRSGCRSATVRQVAWSSRFRVHHRLADGYRNGPVFLAGDAAHVHSPAGGQGMNTGIQDAMMLSGCSPESSADTSRPRTSTGTRRPAGRWHSASCR